MQAKEKDGHRLSQVADQIHAREGKVILDKVDGDGIDGYGLVIVTLRPGDVVHVLKMQGANAEAVGYTDPTPPCGTSDGCILKSPQGLDLPGLGISAYPSGATIPGMDVVVPEGESAVVVSLTA